MEIGKSPLRSLTALKFWVFERSEQRRNKRSVEDLEFFFFQKTPWLIPYPTLASLASLSGKESACECRRRKKCRFNPASVPQERSPGGGNGLDNPVDRGA